MRLKGMTYQKIADKMKISRQRIQQLLSPPPAIRKIVVEKAEGKCQSCGILVGVSGHIHHEGQDFDTYNDIGELRLLCPSCHLVTHLNHSRRIKTERNAKILWYHNKGFTQVAIAGIFHLTQVRVSQIIKKEKEKDGKALRKVR